MSYTNTTATSMETQDLTIEQLVGDITGTMIKSMNTVLEPFVVKINKNTRRDTVINDWLKQLPEYQQLLLENKRLEEENALYKNEGHITMHIKEKPPIVEETANVKTIKTTLADYTLGADQLACMRSRLDEWRNRFNGYVDNLSAEDSHYEMLMTLKQDYDGICYELLVEPARSIVSKSGDMCKHEAITQTSEEENSDSEKEEVVASEEEEEVVASEEEEEEEVVASEEEEEEEEVVASEEEEEEEVVASEEEEVVASEEEEVVASEEEEEEEVVASEEEEEEEVVASEEEEEEEVVASEEEEEDLFVVEMEDDAGNMIEYLTNDDQNGSIFVLEDGDGVGKKVGKFVNGEPELFAE